VPAAADGIRDEDSRRQMLSVAESYDRMAAQRENATKDSNPTAG
jgi:hypothetical protein